MGFSTRTPRWTFRTESFFGVRRFAAKPFTGREKRKNAENSRSRRFALTSGYHVSAVKTRTPRLGLEPAGDLPGKTQDSEKGAAKSGAVDARNADSAGKHTHATEGTVKARMPAPDSDLTRLVEVWPTLPGAIRRGILAMVEAARPEPGFDS